MKGLKWGVLIGSLVMVLALFGPWLYDLLAPPSWPSVTTVWAPLWYGGMIIAGIVAGAITSGSRNMDLLAGVLCAVPGTLVYWCSTEVAPPRGTESNIPVMLVAMAVGGAIGGLISYGIQSLRQRAK